MYYLRVCNIRASVEGGQYIKTRHLFIFYNNYNNNNNDACWFEQSDRNNNSTGKSIVDIKK